MNKSNSMPVLSHQILEKGKGGKPAKHKLQDLENEVNKSRIAIVSHAPLRKT